MDRQKNVVPSTTGIASEDLLYKLAKKQGMNTEIRRNIFMVLMSSGVQHLSLVSTPPFFLINCIGLR